MESDSILASPWIAVRLQALAHGDHVALAVVWQATGTGAARWRKASVPRFCSRGCVYRDSWGLGAALAARPQERRPLPAGPVGGADPHGINPAAASRSWTALKTSASARVIVPGGKACPPRALSRGRGVAPLHHPAASPLAQAARCSEEQDCQKKRIRHRRRAFQSALTGSSTGAAPSHCAQPARARRHICSTMGASATTHRA